MNWVPNVLNQMNSSCHSKITNLLPHFTCLIPPAYLIFLALSVSFFLLLSLAFFLSFLKSPHLQLKKESSSLQLSKKHNKMASNQILHEEFNLTYHVQSKRASSQGQAKVAIMVLVVLSKNKRNKETRKG